MWTRRDQLSAYQFLHRRLSNSFVVANPNHVERPDRRLVISLAVGAGLAALALGVVAVLGFIRPGNATSWQDGGSVIVERETGTRFVLDADGVLHPVLNYTSALLFLGQNASTQVVSRQSLEDTARGLPIGIPGAPDSLPDADSLIDGPWTVCSQASLDGSEPSLPVVAVQAGRPLEGAELDSRAGLLVQVPSETQLHVVADGYRYAVESDSVRAALGYADATVVPVGQGWLNAVPAGPDLAFLSIDGSGEPGPTIDGRSTTVGEVFELSELSDRSELYVLARDGLRPVSETAATLLLAGPENRGRNRDGMPTPLTPAGVAGAPRSSQPGPGAALPGQVPATTAVEGDQVSVCGTIEQEPGGERMAIRLAPETPGLPGTPTLPGEAPGGAPETADQVMVAPGRGAVVRPEAEGSDELSPVSLVTDLGVRYPLASMEIAGVLGYGEEDVVEVSPQYLELFPVGPTLETTVLTEQVETGSSIEALDRR